MARIKDIPKGERPREKALLYGLDSLSNAELLAILIQTGTKEKSALELAYEVLAKTNGIKGLTTATLDDLKSIKGISDAKAIIIKAATLIFLRSESDYCLSDLNSSIPLYFRNKLYSFIQEATYIVIVDSKNQIKNIKQIFLGTTKSVNIQPNLIIRYVLEHGKRFYLVHNHPSQIIHPSLDDQIVTSRIEIMALDAGLEFIDHYIIGKNSYYSFDSGKEQNY